MCSINVSCYYSLLLGKYQRPPAQCGDLAVIWIHACLLSQPLGQPCFLRKLVSRVDSSSPQETLGSASLQARRLEGKWIYSEGMCSSASCHSAISEELFQFHKRKGETNYIQLCLMERRLAGIFTQAPPFPEPSSLPSPRPQG